MWGTYTTNDTTLHLQYLFTMWGTYTTNDTPLHLTLTVLIYNVRYVHY